MEEYPSIRALKAKIQDLEVQMRMLSLSSTKYSDLNKEIKHRVNELEVQHGFLVSTKDLVLKDLSSTTSEETETTFNFIRSNNDAQEDEKTNINTATLQALIRIPQIGKTIGRRVMAARPFNNVKDLLRVQGIGHSRLQVIKNYVCV